MSSSWQARAIGRVIRVIVRRRDWGAEGALANRARRVFGAPRGYRNLAALGVSRQSVQRDGVRGEWLIPRASLPGVVLYAHGGGFVSCSAATHRPISAAIARLTRRSVFSVDYRLAPEARLPAAHDDVAAAYQFLLNSGIDPSHIALVGDSAGGNLVLSLAVQLRDRGRPRPACIAAFSPWTDLTGESPSVGRNAERCAMFYPENMRDFAAAALGDGNPAAPAVSPVYAELHDLPPVLLHVGSTELLLDDATRIHERIRGSNGASSLRVYDDVPHCWQLLFPFVPEAVESLRETAAFIEASLRQR
jgi:epsilon-lactone hydrolase